MSMYEQDVAMVIKEYLESKNTRELMAMLASSRANCDLYETYINGKFTTIHREEIKAMLDTREHIPNKYEGKALRREMAKRKR